MRKQILFLISLIGLFVLGFSSPPPDYVKKTNPQTEYVQIISADQVNVQTDVVFVFNEIALPVPDNPMTDWTIEICTAGALTANSKFSVRDLYATNDLLNITRPCGYWTYLQDKSNKGGNFDNRDKL